MEHHGCPSQLVAYLKVDVIHPADVMHRQKEHCLHGKTNSNMNRIQWMLIEKQTVEHWASLKISMCILRLSWIIRLSMRRARGRKMQVTMIFQMRSIVKKSCSLIRLFQKKLNSIISDKLWLLVILRPIRNYFRLFMPRFWNLKLKILRDTRHYYCFKHLNKIKLFVYSSINESN
jgi:hypothetical protein